MGLHGLTGLHHAKDPSPACLAHTKAAVRIRGRRAVFSTGQTLSNHDRVCAQYNPWILIAYGTVLETCHNGPQPYDKPKETKS